MAREVNVPINIGLKVSGEGKIKELERQVRSLEDEIQSYRSKWEEATRQVMDFQRQLENVRNVSGIAALEEELEVFKATASQAEDEVRNFLRAMNMDELRHDSYISDLINDVKKGALTANQAIASIKANFQHVMEDNYYGGHGLFDSQQVQTFLATLDELSKKVDIIHDKIVRIETDGVSVASGGGGGGGFGANLSEQFKQIAITAEAMSEKGNAAVGQIVAMTTALNEFGGIDVASLLQVAHTFENIANIGQGSFSSKSVDNLVDLARKISNINQNGDFRFSFNLEGLRDFKVSSTIHHLSDFLATLDDGKISSLERLSRINLSNFHQDNLKISKATADNLTEMVKVEQAQHQEAEAVKQTDAAYQEHQKEVEAAAKAEEEKAKISELLSKALEKEKERTESAGKAANQHSQDLSRMLKIQRDIGSLGPRQEKLKFEDPKQYAEVTRQLEALYKEYDLLYKRNQETLNTSEVQKLAQAEVDAQNKIKIAHEAAADTVTKLNDARIAANRKADDEEAARMQKLNAEMEAYYAEQERLEKEAEAKKQAQINSGLDQAARKNLAAEELEEKKALAEYERRNSEIEAEARAKEDAAMRSHVAAVREAKQEEARLNKIAAEEAAYRQKQEKEASEAEAKKQAQINAGLDKAAKSNRDAEAAEAEAEEKRALAEYDRRNAEIAAEALAKEDAAWREHLATLKQAKAEKKQLETASGENQKAASNVQALTEKYEALRIKSVEVSDKMNALNAASQKLANTPAGTEDRKRAMEEYRSALKAATEAVNAQKKAESDYLPTLKQINTQIAQCESAQKKYAAAAKLGVGKEDYSKIQNASARLVELRMELERTGAVTPEIAAEFRKLSEQVSTASANLKTNGNLVGRWVTTGVEQLKSRMTYSLSLAAMVYKATAEIKKMISTAVELDTAMNQLQIVTRASSNDMDAYAKRVSSMAKETAQATKDLIDATTVYARLGYSMDESATLAKYTAMLQGVGDIEAGAAQDAMTAIIKAFDKDVNDVEDVMNKMVVVGNNFPISVSQIAEGMNNAGSMLAVAGNSLEESIALLTASNATVQNISKASTGLRTIAARIRKMDTEDGEIVEESKYNEMIKALTRYNVSLVDANGEYRKTYDIIRDIAAVWEKMSTMQQAAVVEALAGTRQQNIFASLMTQFGDAEKAVNRMNDAGGELEEAYGIYLDSIQAHVNTMKAAFDELSRDFADSDLAKFAVDTLTKLIELLDKLINRVGGIPTILGGVGLFEIIKHFGDIKKLFTPSESALSGAWLFEPSKIEAITASISSLNPVLLALAGIIATVIAVAGEWKKLNTEGYIGEGHELKEYQENVESLEAEVARLQKEYDNLAECGADLTMVENELAHAQNALRNATEEQTKALADQAEQAERTRSALVHLQNGGNVDLLNRPVISSQKLKNAGWGDVGTGGATVFTNTYTNEDNTVAMNFTPILVDGNGNYVGVMSPEELEDYAMGVIEGVHDDYLNLKIGATYFGGHAIEHAEEDAQRIHDLHEEYYKDELKYIADFEDSLNDLSGKTLQKLMRGEKLTREETEELALWLQKSGRSAEESGKLFEDYAKDIRDAAEAQDKLKADKALGDLTSLQDELSETTKALDAYKEAMKGGEKGDAVKEMADIYKGALEDLKSGRVDSRRVHNAAELFFSQEQLAAMNYDMAEIGKALQSSLLQSLFNPEGDSEQSYGQRFAKYIEDNAAKFAKAGAAVEKTADGYRFHYDSLIQLADAFGISAEACSAFLDDLDAYGVEVMRSTEENTELAKQFLEVQQGANSARDAVIEFIKHLYDAGRDSMEIQSILNDLARDGVIKLNSDEINEVLAETMNGLKDIDKESVEPSVELQTASAYADANTLHNYLLRLFSQTITQTVHLDYQGEVSTRQGAGYANYTGPKGNGGSARAQGGVTGKAGPTLVNELGPELISDHGKAFIANNGEPGFVTLSKDAIVFNADETKQIAKDGGLVSGRSAYADGTRKGLIGRLLSGNDVPAKANTWVCSVCGSRNDPSATKCWKCKSPRGTSSAQKANQQAKVNYTSATTSSASSSSSNRWTCNHCGFSNPQSATMCQSCGKVRGSIPERITSPTYTSAAPESTISLSGGSYWKCSNCGRTNSTSVKYCASCGKYRFSTNVTTIPGNTSTGWKAQQSLNYDDLFSFGDDGGSGGGGGVGGADSQSKSNPQKIDWIAVKLNRIQREISDLEKVASSGLKKLDTRLDSAKKEASKLNEEIDIAQKGYVRYIQEANSLGLSLDIADKIHNGTIDINEYDDEELRQQIQEYQEWYITCRPLWQHDGLSSGKIGEPYGEVYGNTEVTAQIAKGCAVP